MEPYSTYKKLGFLNIFLSGVSCLTTFTFIARMSPNLISGVVLVQVLLLFYGLFMLKAGEKDLDKLLGFISIAAVVFSLITGWFDGALTALLDYSFYGVLNGLQLAGVVVTVIILWVVSLKIRG